MVATLAQSRSISVVQEAFSKFPAGRLRCLTDAQRNALIADWLVQEVTLGPASLEALGNYLTSQAWELERDHD